jgi:hypothetical protein
MSTASRIDGSQSWTYGNASRKVRAAAFADAKLWA